MYVVMVRERGRESILNDVIYNNNKFHSTKTNAVQPSKRQAKQKSKTKTKAKVMEGKNCYKINLVVVVTHLAENR